MRTRSILAVLAAAALTVSATRTPVAAAASAAPRRTLTVFAAASLTDAFTDLGHAFERRTPGLVVRFQFAGSPTLVAQLANGARADVLATADSTNMQAASGQSLIAGAASVFARNRLVIVLPRANPGQVHGLFDLARPGIKLVLAGEKVPAGRYARAALRSLDGEPDPGADYSRRVLANVVSEEEDVRGVLAKVMLGEADAGIVYRSDVTGPAASRVRTLALPPAADRIASYPIAVLSAAAEPAAAEAFVTFVRSRAGQRMLAAHGFLAAPAP